MKFQVGNVDAELVKVWGADNPLEKALEFVKAAGWFVGNLTLGPGPEAHGEVGSGSVNHHAMNNVASVTLLRVYTPTAEIGRALQDSISKMISGWLLGDGVNGHNEVVSLHPGSLEKRVINGQEAAVFLVDIDYERGA
ncbi:MAG TPA: hypothetical protein VHC90_24605, partial [Bryobacteraceae bacterium]|nr:hypothetical protein [Bryobacteraceae bacterium]